MEFSQCVARIKTITSAAAKKCGLSYQERDEAIQLGLVEVWKRRHRLASIQCFDAWLQVVAYRICLRLKTNSHRYEFLEDMSPRRRDQTLEAQQPDLRYAAWCEQVRQVLDSDDRAIRTLIVRLHYRDGLATKTISEQLGIPLNTVLSHLRRFRLKLREKLTD